MKDDVSAIQVELLEELLQHFETGVPQLHVVFANVFAVNCCDSVLPGRWCKDCC